MHVGARTRHVPSGRTTCNRMRIRVSATRTSVALTTCVVGVDHSAAYISGGRGSTDLPDDKGGSLMRFTSTSLIAMTLGVAFTFGTSGLAGADKKKGGEVEMEADVATSTPPSKTLERAIKLYDKKDFFSASIELK